MPNRRISIEAHWNWAAVGKLYELPIFRARYAPAFAGATKLWIRRDARRTHRAEADAAAGFR